MTASRDPDRLIRAFLREGEEELADQVYDAVRASIEHKRQRAVIGPWRTPDMNKLVFGLAAAAVVVIGLFLGNQLLVEPTNVGGPSEPTATPQPTLASGSFTVDLGEFGQAFDIEATGAGDDATGTMEVSFPEGGGDAYSVDVQCTRTAEDGTLMIGGEVTSSTYGLVSEGAYVVIALVPDSPARALLGIDVMASDPVPAPAESCTAFIDELVGDAEFLDGVNDHAVPITGELVLGQ